MRLDGKVILITGASAGIGRALAIEYHNRGATPVLVARRAERIEALAQQLSHGAPALALVGDVTSQESLDAVVKQCLEKFGRLDVVIANAGFGVVGNFENLKIADYQKQFETNIYGVLKTVRACLPALKKSGGCIGIIGSVAGYIALPGGSPYSMSKAAIRAYCDALYQELKPLGVSVTHIAPGFVSSEIRSVSNDGVFHEAIKDPIPKWLLMSSEKAAVQILRAVTRRKREAVLTAHGKLAVFFQRHFAGALAYLIALLKIGNRKEAKSEGQSQIYSNSQG